MTSQRHDRAMWRRCERALSARGTTKELETCAICLESLETSVDAMRAQPLPHMTTVCDHVYHYHCWETYSHRAIMDAETTVKAQVLALVGPKCPVCRTEVPCFDTVTTQLIMNAPPSMLPKYATLDLTLKLANSKTHSE